MCASTRSRPNKRAAVVAAQPPAPADKKPAAVRRPIAGPTGVPLQLLADGIPPADPTGRASRRPNEDGARHGEPSYDEFVERWMLGMDASVL